MRAHHYSLQVLTVLHTRRCSVFPKLYPIPKLFSFLLSFSLFLSFCPALPPPIRNSASQDPLRACVSCLSCLVSFSPPGRTTRLLPLSLDTDTNLSRNRPHRRSIPLRALLTKTKGKENKREFTSIAASDQTEKSRCICIIVHTIQYIYTITPFVVVCCFLNNNNNNNQKPKPATPLPCHKKQRKKQRKAKKEGSTQFHLVTAPGLPLYLFRSHSLPFWEVAQVQYIYTYYDPRKNLLVDSLPSR